MCLCIYLAKKFQSLAWVSAQRSADILKQILILENEATKQQVNKHKHS